MLKTTKKKNKLKHAIIWSIALHCLLITALIWNLSYQPQESSVSGGELPIDAMIVDPTAVIQQYNRQQQQQADVQQMLHSLKALEKQQLAAQETAEVQQREQIEQQKQTGKSEKQTQARHKQVEATPAKPKVPAKAKQQAQTAAAEAKEKAEVETKKAEAADIKAEQAAKDKDAKQSSNVDALLGSLMDIKNAPKAGGGLIETGKAKKSSASRAEIDAYKAQVSWAISNKFYDASNYSHRTCHLRIKLTADGLLTSINIEGGDPALCQAAVSAAKLATIPRPPSPQVYEVFRNVTLGFSPQ
ncbi:MAG: cell envelope integrity protein TolA [Sodalis sp. (in: enterobacteria)]